MKRQNLYKPFRRLACTAVTIAFINTVGAQIMIDATNTAKVDGFTGSYTLFPTYTVGTSDKLVVVVQMERDRGDANTSINSVTYAGTSMTVAVLDKGWGEGPVGIFYLDNPSSIASSGDIVANGSAKMNGSLGTVLRLTGTEDGVASTNSTAGTSTSVTTNVADALVVAGYMANGAGAATADAPLTQLLSSNGGNNYFNGSSGYQAVATPATITPSFSGGSGTTPMTVAAVFEPSAGSTLPNIIDIALDGSGNVILTLDGSEAGLTVQSSNDLTDGSFADVPSTSPRANQLQVDATDVDSNGDGADFFRVRN